MTTYDSSSEIHEIETIFRLVDQGAISRGVAAQELRRLPRPAFSNPHFAYIDTIERFAADYLFEESPTNRQEIWDELRVEWNRLRNITTSSS